MPQILTNNTMKLSTAIPLGALALLTATACDKARPLSQDEIAIACETRANHDAKKCLGPTEELEEETLPVECEELRVETLNECLDTLGQGGTTEDLKRRELKAICREEVSRTLRLREDQKPPKKLVRQCKRRLSGKR